MNQQAGDATGPGAPGGASPDAGRCGATCEGIPCRRLPGHAGLLHQTAPYERLSNGGRDFGTVYPPGWHRGDGLDDVRSRWGERARQLSRMSTARLRATLQEMNRDAGRRVVLGGPEVMSKDELLAEIQDREFPREDPDRDGGIRVGPYQA